MSDTNTSKETPLPDESPSNDWTCSIITEPKEQGSYTVGEVFQLECEGEDIAFVDPLTVKAEDAEEYQLVLLKQLKVSDREVLYQATSYRVGDHRKPIVFVDAEGKEFKAENVQYKVRSVLEQKKPFGSIMPMATGYPVWLFFGLIVAAMVVVGWVLVFLKRRLQKRSLEKNIKKFQSPLGSYNQYSKDMRRLKRTVVFSERNDWAEEQVKSYLEDLDESFRLFVLREYVVPATTWPSRRVLTAVRKKDKRNFGRYGSELSRAFKELDRAKQSVNTVNSKDCEQLTKICWKVVDKIWHTTRRSK